MKKFQLFFVALQMGFVLRAAFVLFGLLFAGVAATERSAPLLAHEVVATLPHDEEDFTQGLLFHGGELIESTGRRGRSALIRKSPDGSVLQRRSLPRNQFGEGIAVAGGRLFQLTWTAGVAWIYDLSLRRTGSFQYGGEGWGLAFDGAHLLMSDGSARITFRSPDTFDVTGGITVRDGGQPVQRLNELEYARGWLYANVFQRDHIAVIEPYSGRVVGWHDLSALRKGFIKPPAFDPADHVLNGIAWDPVAKMFYITGKCWPVMYRVRLKEPKPAAGKAAPG